MIRANTAPAPTAALATLAALAALPAMIASAAPVAHAGGAGAVRVVRGGPGGDAARGEVERAVGAIAPVLAVCWRRGAPGRVQVELSVARTGEVTRAAQVTRGPAAQCAAGILAVHALPRVKAAYRMTVEIETRGAPGDADAIQASLAPHRDELDRCHRAASARSPGLAGRVVLSFTIHPDGRLTEPKIASSALGHRGVEKCLLDVIRAARVTRGVVASPVGYSLSLDFAAGERAGPASRSSRGSRGGRGGGGQGGQPGLQPKKDGPLAADAIQAVMVRRKADFSACYDRRARKAPKGQAPAGQVVLRFTIRDDGTVRNVKVRETTLSHPAIERCLVKVGGTLRFPAEPGRAPTRVQYPFAFSTR